MKYTCANGDKEEDEGEGEGDDVSMTMTVGGAVDINTPLSCRR